ncbi:MAG: Crp/Fnr family transcriptional regulator [Coriobacteriales bacterium]|jgi:CRP/FNR family cyclic AMP-dependent transcriptional regulator|nr:Crp/Fnr family transcriptional regulator [Coriobacteriales bacterium]
MTSKEDFTAVLVPTMPYHKLKIGQYIDQAKKRKLFKGEAVYASAEELADLYYFYVETGQLRCTFIKLDGEAATLFYRNAGNAFSVEYSGIASLYRFKMRFVATTDTVVFGFTQAQLYELCQRDPGIFFEFIFNCHMAFGQMGHRLADSSMPSAMQRLIFWLLKLCAIYEADEQGVHTIHANITIEQLAELLNIHVSTCSRLLTTLESEGHISRNRSIIKVFEAERLYDYEQFDPYHP